MNPPDQSEVVEVYAAQDDAEAHLLLALLAEAGIEARVVGEVLQSGLPLGAATTPRLWVRQPDYELARQVIANWARAPATSQEPQAGAPCWTCPTCGETVDEEYERCWNCMTPRKPH